MLTLSPPPPAVKSAEILTSQPTPNRNPFEPVNSKKLSNTIDGLEDMVQEAVDIAGDTNDQDQVEGIYEIIEDATNAIQQAYVAPTRNLMATTSPLEIS